MGKYPEAINNMHTRNQQQRRMLGEATLAHAEARKFGHVLGPFEMEAGWDSAVALCRCCGALGAIDLGERPYRFGPAFDSKKRCQ